MSAAERWERTAQRPDPKPLARLTRPQLAARVQLLRDVLDRLLDQAARDGGEGFRCRGQRQDRAARLGGCPPRSGPCRRAGGADAARSSPWRP